MEAVYLDTETTGLDHRVNELLEIGIIDGEGRVLVDSLIKPIMKKSWEEAEKINHISPKMVANSPSIDLIKDAIIKAVKGKVVYIWNAKFDISFLPFVAEHAKEVVCAMAEFGAYIERTQPQNRSQSGRYKMTYVANDLGIATENAHRAIDDTRIMLAIRECYLSSTFNRTDLTGSVGIQGYQPISTKGQSND